MSKLTTLPLVMTYVIGKAHPIVFIRYPVPFGGGYGHPLGGGHPRPYSFGDGSDYCDHFRLARSKELRDE